METRETHSRSPGHGAGWYRWLLAPLHLLALATKAKSFRANPVLGSPLLNRLGLHAARRRLAHQAGIRRRRKLRSSIAEDDRVAFERDGFLIKANFLDPATFRAVRDEVMNFEAEAREVVSGDSLTRLIPLDSRNLAQLAAVRGVIEGARYRALLAYVGSSRHEPEVFAQTVFGRVHQGERDEQTFLHCDTFHPTVKSWLYLEDVGADALPFVYAPGSHRLNRRRLAWERRRSVHAASSADRHTAEGSLRISEREVRRLGYAAPRALAVAANTLIVADTSGFHARGAASSQARRVAIYGFSRSNPFVPWIWGNLGALPAVRQGARRLYRALGRSLARAHVVFRHAPRPVGRRSPTSPAAAPQERATAGDAPPR